MSETIAIFGGRGMLGSDLAPVLARAGYAVRVLDLPACDITRADHLARGLDGVEAAVNCAAFTAVDRAESREAAALAVNGRAVGALGAAARARGLYVLHVSTDFVFDGALPRPYTERDRPAPINAYGRTKLEGERALARSGAAAAIVRVQWSYGRHGTHFIGMIRDRLRSGQPLKVVADQVGAPTWTADMAEALAVLIRGRREGLYHFANSGYASRYQVAAFVADRLGLPGTVTPCSSADFPAPARRPANSRFDTSKIQALLDAPIRPWQDALAAYLDSLDCPDERRDGT